MGYPLVDLLLPWRLLAQLLHLISAIYTIAWMPDTALVTIMPSTPEAETDEFWTNYITVVALAALTIVGLLIEFIAMGKGATLMSPRFNLYFIVSHTVAVVLTFWMLMSGWTFMVYVTTYLLFTLPPVLLELVCCLLRVFHQLKLQQDQTTTLPQGACCYPPPRPACCYPTTGTPTCCYPLQQRSQWCKWWWWT